MRHVHWPSTARHGSVMVREFEEERTRRLAILVDASRDAGEVWTPLDRCCSAAASLALAASAEGHGVRLAAGREHGPEVVGRADEAELLRWLALLEPAAEPYAGVVEALAPDLRGAQTIALVFPGWRDNDAEAMAAAVEAVGVYADRVVCLPVAAEGPDALPDGLFEAMVGAVRDAGAETYPWRRGVELVSALGAAAGGSRT